MVSSFLEARGLRYVWYQIDPDDNDVATFFYYLRLALINEDDRLNRLEDALHFYKLYVDLGGTEEWVPDRITALEEYLAGNK